MEPGRGLTAAKPAVLLGDVLQREAHRREARRDLALDDLVAEADAAAPAVHLQRLVALLADEGVLRTAANTNQ